MLGFIIRKTFYDLWDNFLNVVILNLAFMLLWAGLFYLPGAVGAVLPAAPLTVFCRLVFIFLLSAYASVLARVLNPVADYGVFKFESFLEAVKKSLPAALSLTVFVFLFFLFLQIIIPFYAAIGGFFGSFLSATVFWIFLALCLAVQFLPAVFARQEAGVKPLLKETIFFFIDNPFFGLNILVVSLCALVLSIVFAFMWPGPAGIILLWTEAYRIRALKYEWIREQIEKNPGFRLTRKVKIPWEAILLEEREITGKRSLRQMIFPWKQK
ncbi:MAG: hypothetical protein LBC53_00335 [Spirochaetaceae bacterium]|jgi:hypothetical protein|nr:hypothetical protein [Spirochaetaceae bacterium]